MDGEDNDFWERRPELVGVNRQLLNAFWRLRRETHIDSVIKSVEIEREVECILIEPDIGLMIIQSIDDHYRKLYTKEMNRKRAQK